MTYFILARDGTSRAYGKTVWSWHPWLVSSCRWRIRSDRIGWAIKPAGMEARRIRLQGERGISRQTIAQGMPECSSCTCMLVCASHSTLHTRPRVQQAPGIPCTLSDRGWRKQASDADCAARTHVYVSFQAGNPRL